MNIGDFDICAEDISGLAQICIVIKYDEPKFVAKALGLKIREIADSEEEAVAKVLKRIVWKLERDAERKKVKHVVSRVDTKSKATSR